MEITFNLPHVYFPGSSLEEDAYVLRHLLDCQIAINRDYIRFHSPAALYRSGVVYERTKIWDSLPACYAKRYGDCKTLAPILIAEYQLQQIPAKPVFRYIVRDDGNKDVHILVQTNKGYEDPSKVLGMPTAEVAPFYDPTQYKVLPYYY
jgi:hypothetical protein